VYAIISVVLGIFGLPFLFPLVGAFVALAVFFFLISRRSRAWFVGGGWERRDLGLSRLFTAIIKVNPFLIAVTGHVIFVVTLLNFIWVHNSLLDVAVTALSSAIVFLAVFHVKPPIVSMPEELEKVRCGTAFDSSTYFLAFGLCAMLLFSDTFGSYIEYLMKLIGAMVVLVGTVILQRAVSSKLGYRPLGEKLHAREYSRYLGYYWSNTTFSIVLAIGGDLLVGTLSYLLSLLLFFAGFRNAAKRSPLRLLDQAIDTFTSAFRRNAAKNPSIEAYLGLTAIYFIPLSVLTNFSPTTSSLLLSSLMVIPPVLSAVTTLRISFKRLLFVGMPVVLVFCIWLIFAFPDAYPPAVQFSNMMVGAPIHFSAQEETFLFIAAIYTIPTATILPMSIFLQGSLADKFDLDSVERSGNRIMLGAIVPAVLIVLAYAALFRPDVLQLGWLSVITPVYVLLVVVVCGTVIHNSMMEDRDRLPLVAPIADFATPPLGGFYVMIENPLWKNDLFSVVVFQNA
jgi:hypothetical protein